MRDNRSGCKGKRKIRLGEKRGKKDNRELKRSKQEEDKSRELKKQKT